MVIVCAIIMAATTAWVFLVPAEREWIIGRLLYDLRDLDEFFSTTRQFADLTCTIVILLIVWIYRRTDRAVIVPFVVALLLSGLATTIVKGAVSRSRPEYSVVIDAKRTKRLADYAKAHPEVNLRVGEHQILFLEPAKQFVAEWRRTGKLDKDNYPSGFDSFPSGHSNHAFVLAAFLCLLWPRANWIWIVIATGCALARVRYERHFATDVIAGGAFGWLFAHWVMSWHWTWALGQRWLTPRPEDAAPGDDKSAPPATDSQSASRTF